MTLNDVVLELIARNLSMPDIQKHLSAVKTIDGVPVSSLSVEDDPEVIWNHPISTAKVDLSVPKEPDESPKVDMSNTPDELLDAIDATANIENDKEFKKALNETVSQLPEVKEDDISKQAENEIRNAEIVAKNEEVLKKLGPMASTTDILNALGITGVRDVEGVADGIPLESKEGTDIVETDLITPRERRLLAINKGPLGYKPEHREAFMLAKKYGNLIKGAPSDEIEAFTAAKRLGPILQAAQRRF